MALADDEMLDRLQHAAFNYFLRSANPDNGLVADTTRDGSPSSIAVVGFALSAYGVGVERGWIERADAVQLASTRCVFSGAATRAVTPMPPAIVVSIFIFSTSIAGSECGSQNCR